MAGRLPPPPAFRVICVSVRPPPAPAPALIPMLTCVDGRRLSLETAAADPAAPGSALRRCSGRGELVEPRLAAIPPSLAFWASYGAAGRSRPSRQGRSRKESPRGETIVNANELRD